MPEPAAQLHIWKSSDTVEFKMSYELLIHLLKQKGLPVDQHTLDRVASHEDYRYALGRPNSSRSCRGLCSGS
jgi:hypothetical protein